MTIWNAIATFSEKEVGSLEPGKWADFVILDTDLAAALRMNKKLRVRATYVAGEQVN